MKNIILRILAVIAAPFYLPMAWFKAYRLSRKKHKLLDLYDMEKAYKFVLRVAKFVRLFKNIEIDIRNMDKWKYTPGLIVSNHQSNADGMILLLALSTNEKFPQELAFIAKSELINDKLFSPFLKTIKTYFIDRKSIRQIVDVFNEAKKEITENKTNLVVFPEGTRSNSPVMKPFIPGAFKLALQTYAPIKPVAIIDSYRLFEKGHKKGRKVKVIFCEEIPADKVMMMNTVGLSKHIFELIKGQVDEHSITFENDGENASSEESEPNTTPKSIQNEIPIEPRNETNDKSPTTVPLVKENENNTQPTNVNDTNNNEAIKKS